jgi:hypothetical protein
MKFSEVRPAFAASSDSATVTAARVILNELKDLVDAEEILHFVQDDIKSQ